MLGAAQPWLGSGLFILPPSQKLLSAQLAFFRSVLSSFVILQGSPAMEEVWAVIFN